MASVINPTLLGNSWSAAMNRRFTLCADSNADFFAANRWPMGFYFDNEMNFGIVFGRTSGATGGGYFGYTSPTVEGPVGTFDANTGTIDATVHPNEPLQAPDASYTNPMPGVMTHQSFGSDVANFSNISMTIRVKTGSVPGFGGVGTRVRQHVIGMTTPNNVDMTTGGGTLRAQVLSATSSGTPNTEVAALHANLTSAFRSNGSPIPHGVAKVLSSGNGTIPDPGGSGYFAVYLSIYQFFYNESGHTNSRLWHALEKVDVSNNPIPNSCGFFPWGGGGWKTNDFSAAGNAGTFDGWAGTRTVSTAAMQTLSDWYQQSAWLYAMMFNDVFSNDVEYAAYVTMVRGVLDRLLSIRDVPILAIEPWPTFFDPGGFFVVNDDYSWTVDVGVGGPRWLWEKKCQALRTLAAEKPNRLMVVPLGTEIIERYGVPNHTVGGNWINTLIANESNNRIHTNQAGALEAYSIIKSLMNRGFGGGGAGRATASFADGVFDGRRD